MSSTATNYDKAKAYRPSASLIIAAKTAETADNYDYRVNFAENLKIINYLLIPITDIIV